MSFIRKGILGKTVLPKKWCHGTALRQAQDDRTVDLRGLKSPTLRVTILYYAPHMRGWAN